MKGATLRSTLTFLLVLLLGTSALGQMSSHLREEFSDPEAYGIRVVESVSGLRNALADKNTRVLSFQVFGETPTPEQIEQYKNLKAEKYKRDEIFEEMDLTRTLYNKILVALRNE